jgi:hypothetical protein
MTGRSLHNALLTVLCDGRLRAHLLDGTAPAREGLSDDEWSVLARLPKPRLRGLSRFFARHYYQERVVRLFRYVRLLAPLTGRDPCRVLQDPAIIPVLDSAVLGSPASAARVLAAIETYLTDHDEGIQEQWPFWRDLVRYQAAAFQVEAQGVPPPKPTPHALRSPAMRILDFEWDLPALFAQLRSQSCSAVSAVRTPSTLLLTRRSHGQVLTVRCAGPMRVVLESADGQRSAQELAYLAGLSPDRIGPLLRQLQDIGALL